MRYDAGEVITAMVTPFDEKREVDYEKVEALAKYLVNTGSDAVLVTGTTGEAPTLTYDEEIEILCSVKRAVNSQGKVIMGTGSNSCLYENGNIVRNIRPGGYILGDEGSGVCLGRMFLADFVKGMLPPQVESDFVSEYGLDYAKIVRKVYKEPAASAFRRRKGKPLTAYFSFAILKQKAGRNYHEKSRLHQLERIFYGHCHAGRHAQQGPQHPGGLLHRFPGEYHHLHRLHRYAQGLLRR